jgi:hypothetical protein
VEAPEKLPEPLPATLYLWVSPDGATFQLHPAGLSPEGQPQLLRDDRGAPLVLPGLFNPELRATPAWGERAIPERP